MAFRTEDVCPECRRPFRSTYLSIHESTNQRIVNTPISDGLINIQGMSISINPLSNTEEPRTSCTNAECRARGFDCCLNNQCVVDGAEKPNSTNDPEYFQSRVDIQRDSDLFINYPNIYYVCQQRPTPEEPVLETSAGRCTNPDILSESACIRAGFEFIPTERIAELTFERNILEYNCLEEADTEDPIYNRGACSDPTKFSKAECEESGASWSFNCFSQDDFSEEELKMISFL